MPEQNIKLKAVLCNISNKVHIFDTVLLKS
jgi:hypothetical protein